MEAEQFQKAQETVLISLTEGLTQLAASMAEIISENDPHAGKMTPKKAERERLSKALEAEFILFRRRFELSCHPLLLALDELTKTHPEIYLESIARDFHKLQNTLLAIDAKKIEEAFSRNWSFQELAGMQDSTIEALYQAARLLYEREQYEEAAALFGILTFFNAKHFIFWIGLGNSEFFLQRFEAALKAYAIAVHANPDEATPHLYSAKCFEELQQLDNALNALNTALFVLRGRRGQEALMESVEQEKERLTMKKRGS